MGAPAGLKLNSVLSQSLGKFFLYHIHLWVTFLYVTTPYLSDIFHRAMYVLSWMGFCFQVQCPPLNRITLEQHKSDNNNRMIQLTEVFLCTVGA